MNCQDCLQGWSLIRATKRFWDIWRERRQVIIILSSMNTSLHLVKKTGFATPTQRSFQVRLLHPLSFESILFTFKMPMEWARPCIDKIPTAHTTTISRRILSCHLPKLYFSGSFLCQKFDLFHWSWFCKYFIINDGFQFIEVSILMMHVHMYSFLGFKNLQTLNTSLT